MHVGVNHTLFLSVPYANWLFSSLDKTDGRTMDFGPGEYGMVIHATCHLTNEGAQDYVDVEPFADP